MPQAAAVATLRPLPRRRRKECDVSNEELMASVTDELIFDPKVDEAGIAVSVTLKGTAAWQFERDEAEFVAGNVEGVVGIDNLVEITTPQPQADDVQKSIEKAFKRVRARRSRAQSIDSIGSRREHPSGGGFWAPYRPPRLPRARPST